MIIYVQHLQICFKLVGTVEKRQVLVCHTKSMEKIMLNQHFVMLISDLFEPVGPPLILDMHVTSLLLTYGLVSR